MIRVVQLDQTCWACPSQWEGMTDDGRAVYIRFRYGCLTAQVDDGQQETLWTWPYVYDEQISDGLDGVLSTRGMQERLVGVMEFA